MAISRAQLLKELLPGLNELFGTEYEHKNTWAVFADYHHEDMTWRVGKIVHWNDRHGVGSRFHRNIYKIKATDELDAYKKFMEQTK